MTLVVEEPQSLRCVSLAYVLFIALYACSVHVHATCCSLYKYAVMYCSLFSSFVQWIDSEVARCALA